MKLGLCLLTLNELEGCKLDVPRLPLSAFDEVFAMDGGSRDGTAEYLASAGIPVLRQSRRGYNLAYIEAFAHSSAEALVVYHPKGSIDPATLLAFRPRFEAGADLVVASRIIRGAVNEEDGQLLKPRKWFVAGLALLSAALWLRSGPMIWDVLHGFRGMRVDAFRAIGLTPEGLSADLEMVVAGYRLGLALTEFPVTETPRPHGATHFKALPTGWKLLKYLKAELLRRR